MLTNDIDDTQQQFEPNILKNLFNQSSKVLLLVVITVCLIAPFVISNIGLYHVIPLGLATMAALWNRLNSRDKYSVDVCYNGASVKLNAGENGGEGASVDN